MDNIDISVPAYMNLWLFHTAFVIATLVLISYSTPIFLVMFLPLTVVFVVVQVRDNERKSSENVESLWFLPQPLRTGLSVVVQIRNECQG